MVKALVTGGTGFVGSHVVRALLEAGHTVRVQHRVTSRLDALAGLDYEACLGDVLDEASLEAACADCEWVFHVAAVADYWQVDQARLYAVNVEGTRRVLRAARATGVRRVLFTSSAAAVGLRTDKKPSDERFGFRLSPHRFPYGHSKALAEDVVRYAVETYGQDIVTLNPVVVMGPGDLNMISGRFITEIARWQWTAPLTVGGSGMVDVRDVARWHVMAAERGRTGERYLLGTANYTWYDIYAMVADTVGVARPFLVIPRFLVPMLAEVARMLAAQGVSLPVDGDQVRMSGQPIFFDYRKAWAAFDPPQIAMHQSFEDTYRWYLENGYIHAPWFAPILAALGPSSLRLRRPAL